MKFKKTKTIKIVSIILASLLVVSLLAVVIRNVNKEKTIEPESIKYVVGTLDDEGLEKKSDTTLRSKNFLEYDEFYVELTEDSNIQYKIFYYDENEEYLLSTDYLTTTYVVTKENVKASEGVGYFKILVEPIIEEDEEIKLTTFNKKQYTKQLKLYYDEYVVDPEANALYDEGIYKINAFNYGFQFALEDADNMSIVNLPYITNGASWASCVGEPGYTSLFLKQSEKYEGLYEVLKIVREGEYVDDFIDSGNYSDFISISLKKSDCDNAYNELFENLSSNLKYVFIEQTNNLVIDVALSTAKNVNELIEYQKNFK